MDFKYKIKGEELYIFLDFNSELSNDFLTNAKEKLSSFNDEVSSFARKIGFRGKHAKIIIQGVLVATIALGVTAESKDAYVINQEKSEVINESNDKELVLDINQYFLPPNSKKYGKKMNPKYIVVHNTANSASAYNEIRYLHSTSNMNYVSFHYAVDEEEIWQALPTDVNGWHAGDGSDINSYNRNSIGVEIARSTIHNDLVRDDSLENAAKLIAYLMVEHNIPMENVITHYDASGKYCPHDIFDRYGWENFNRLVSSYLY